MDARWLPSCSNFVSCATVLWYFLWRAVNILAQLLCDALLCNFLVNIFVVVLFLMQKKNKNKRNNGTKIVFSLNIKLVFGALLMRSNNLIERIVYYLPSIFKCYLFLFRAFCIWREMCYYQRLRVWSVRKFVKYFFEICFYVKTLMKFFFQ